MKSILTYQVFNRYDRIHVAQFSKAGDNDDCNVSIKCDTNNEYQPIQFSYQVGFQLNNDKQQRERQNDDNELKLPLAVRYRVLKKTFSKMCLERKSVCSLLQQLVFLPFHKLSNHWLYNERMIWLEAFVVSVLNTKPAGLWPQRFHKAKALLAVNLRRRKTPCFIREKKR